MTVQYNILKRCLRQAAVAAGSVLEDLMELPEDPSNIISMFTSALDKINVNSSESLTQIRSSSLFRQSCSHLRLKIIDMGRSLPNDMKAVNLQKWCGDVIDLWSAV